MFAASLLKTLIMKLLHAQFLGVFLLCSAVTFAQSGEKVLPHPPPPPVEVPAPPIPPAPPVKPNLNETISPPPPPPAPPIPPAPAEKSENPLSF